MPNRPTSDGWEHSWEVRAPDLRDLPVSCARWRRVVLRLNLRSIITASMGLQEIARDVFGRVERAAAWRCDRLERALLEATAEVESAALARRLYGAAPGEPESNLPKGTGMTIGSGKFIKPVIPPTVNCRHPSISGGANQSSSWTVCNRCKSRVTIDLVPISELEKFNQGFIKTAVRVEMKHVTLDTSGVPPRTPLPARQTATSPSSMSAGSHHPQCAPALVCPLCPRCGEPMVVKTNRTYGGSFWGCQNFPICQGTRPKPEALAAPTRCSESFHICEWHDVPGASLP